VEFFGQVTWNNSLEKVVIIDKMEGKRAREWQSWQYLDSLSSLLVEERHFVEAYRFSRRLAAEKRSQCYGWHCTLKKMDFL